MSTAADSLVYVHCKDQHWVPATVVAKEGTTVTVVVLDPKTMKQVCNTVNLRDYPNQVLPLQNVDVAGNLHVYPDMKDLPFLSEATILYNLKARLANQKPYTKTGSIVIAVNPYQWYPALYSAEMQQRYTSHIVYGGYDNQRKLSPLPPHVYETSAAAYKGLLMGSNQSILVSGESGAGKTETVKIAMNHIARMGLGNRHSKKHAIFINSNEVVQRVIDSNRLMEAFGNAATRRNDNSSRFGKYLQLQFELGEVPEEDFYHSSRKSRDCHLVGSQTEVYLLEKSRVVHHEDQERSFHIFYQLLAAPDSTKGQFWDHLRGKNAASFKYLTHTESTLLTMVEGKSDAQHFQETVDALALVGVTGEKLFTLFRAVGAVLQVGNIQFQGCADQSFVSSVAELRILADLLGLSVDTLSSAFTQRTLVTGGGTVISHLNVAAAQESCDYLAKAIYESAFMWLVQEINGATSVPTASSNKSGIIGLLDIFGFESFEQNCFEQLCINYANEKLQHKFTGDIFCQVQAEYEMEGLDTIDIGYVDNGDVLDLIENRLGLLDILNDECLCPSGSDKEFVYKAIKENRKSSALVVDRRHTPLQFGIHHYAGTVVYTAGNFLQKNNDTLSADLMQCAGQSTNEIVARAHVGKLTSATNKSLVRCRRSSIAGTTVWTKYKTGMRSLMEELHKTQSQYIRCIKPNEHRMPAIMEHGPTLDQLRSAGVIAAVTLTRSAFPNRLDHESVLARFRHLGRQVEKCEKTSASPTRQVKRILKPLLKHMATVSNDGGHSIKAYAVGKTRTYFRAGALEHLASLRIKGFDPAAVKIQKAARGFLVRKQARNIYVLRRDAAIVIQTRARVCLSEAEVQRARDEKHARQQQRKAATTIATVVRGVLRRIKFRKELEDYREVQAMQNELERLQRQLEESERHKETVVKEAGEQVRATMARLHESEEARSSSDSSTSSSAAYKLLNQKTAMIEKMRSDNKRARGSVKLWEGNYKALMTEARKLKVESDKIMGEFLGKNEEAKAMKGELDQSIREQQALKHQLTAVVTELKREHTLIVESSTLHEKFQVAMADIVKILRRECHDEQLVEDAIMIALESDTEAKVIQAGFDALMASTMPIKTQVVSAVPSNVGCDADNSHTDVTEDNTSTESSISDTEDQLEREEAGLEEELRALELNASV